MPHPWLDTFSYDSDLATVGSTTSGAVFDRRGRYRYVLWRCWSRLQPEACFIMLNPSTADHERNDPTISRCIQLAKFGEFGAVHVVNLFAWRATNPAQLYGSRDPVGARNDEFIERAAQATHSLVVAWGNHGRLLHRDADVLSALAEATRLKCYGLTKQGQPRHLLYLRRDAQLRLFR